MLYLPPVRGAFVPTGHVFVHVDDMNPLHKELFLWKHKQKNVKKEAIIVVGDLLFSYSVIIIIKYDQS